MSDCVDFANDLVQERLDNALAARKARPVFESYEFCTDCDVSITLAHATAVTNLAPCLAMPPASYF